MEAIAVPVLGALGRSFVSLLFDSGPFAKFILLLLFVMSVVSWAIIYDRTRLYLSLRRGGIRLQSAVHAQGLQIPAETIRRSTPSVEAALIAETRRYFDMEAPAGAGGRSTGQLKQLLDGRATSEISEMEKYLIFLATTASVSPFLGLLGTVWGIMSSFMSMGVQGTASIEVVGPGIAEALVTTIAGLGTAITALVGYNLLIRHVHRVETRIELFVSRILALTGAQVNGSSYTAPPGTVRGASPEGSYEKRSV